MSEKQYSTTWMWQSKSGGTHGVSFDKDDLTLAWFDDAAGCGCVDSVGEQTLAQFRERGAMLGLPDDIRAELLETLAHYENQAENEPQHQNA